MDRKSGIRFLIDTGADDHHDKHTKQSNITLYAANNSRHTEKLNLQLILDFADRSRGTLQSLMFHNRPSEMVFCTNFGVYVLITEDWIIQQFLTNTPFHIYKSSHIDYMEVSFLTIDLEGDYYQ